MEFSITNKLDQKLYFKNILITFYKKPALIIATIIGLIIFYPIFLDLAGIKKYSSSIYYFELTGSLFILFAPLLATIYSYNSIKQNKALNQTIQYTFDKESLLMTGETFTNKLNWNHFTKYKEFRDFIVLYISKGRGIFIEKKQLTPPQILFIKTMINNNKKPLAKQTVF